jgi:hypothetical protein
MKAAGTHDRENIRIPFARVYWLVLVVCKQRPRGRGELVGDA